jgi:hypothetical protein
MVRRTLIFFTISILFLFGVSCSVKEKAIKEAEFQKLFPINAMNTKLKFEKSNPNVPILNFADPEDYSMSFGKSVKLMLWNQSEDTIQFPFPKNFHLYTYNAEKNTWLEIDNTEKYFLRNDKMIFQPKSQSSPFSFMMVIFEPQRNPHVDNNVIRVVAVGDIMKNGVLTGEQTGAYIDLELKP